MADPKVKRLPDIPRRGVRIKEWAVDTTQAVRSLAGGVQRIDDDGATGLTPRLLRVELVNDQGDYLECKPVGADGVAYGSIINVAKPFLLRRTPFEDETREGITYTYSANDTRTGDDGSTTETQVVVPAYVAGDQIYASYVQTNTGVTVDDVNIRLIDMNLDARAWAKQAS